MNENFAALIKKIREIKEVQMQAIKKQYNRLRSFYSKKLFKVKCLNLQLGDIDRDVSMNYQSIIDNLNVNKVSKIKNRYLEIIKNNHDEFSVKQILMKFNKKKLT